MGHKKVCLDCRVAFNRPFDSGSGLTYPCPNCSKSMLLLPHRFRPPKKSDDKKWEVVEFLIRNGFYYQHIVDDGLEPKNGETSHQNYPRNMREAKEFIKKYVNQSRK